MRPGAVSGFAIALGLRAVYDTCWLRVNQERLGTTRPLLGLRAVQLSDLHGRTHFLNGPLAQQVNALRPDVVLVTGDLVNDHADLPRVLAELRRIRCPHIYFVPGNYEREDAAGGQKRALDEAEYQTLLATIGQQMTVLANAGAVLGIAGHRLYLHGFDNARYGDERPPTRSFPNSDRVILLAHSPSIIGKIREWGLPFDALLTGHTHGGQIRLLGRTSGPYRHYLPGKNPAPEGLFYINRGLGTVRLPLRLGVPPELLLLLL